MTGCHPSRWIYELLHNNFTTCDLFDRANHVDFDAPFDWRHPHRLVVNGNQSTATSEGKVLSSICLDCHFHFVFKLAWDPAHAHEQCNAAHATWPMRDGVYPWHHLAWAGSEADHILMSEWSKNYPIRGREHFACVAPPCTFQVTLEISEPRMGSEWIALLQDQDTILRELKRAKQEDPQRYELATEEWAKQAPQNLNTYLKNLLESDAESARSISKRNKRFTVVFGPRCFGLFRALGFKEVIDIQDGVDEGTFTPVPPDPPTEANGITKIGTFRAYIEDIRTETQSLIHKMGHETGENPSFINAALHTDLGCKEVPGAANNVFVNIERYKLLGILPDQPRDIVASAYFRQWDLLPNKRREMVDALMAVANDSNDEQLSDFAMNQSSVFDSQLPVQTTSDNDGLVTQALLFLGLAPPNNYSAEAILDAFRRKLVDDPEAALTAKSMLLLIAQQYTDADDQTTLIMEVDPKMSLGTAMFIFGGNVPEKTESDWYHAILRESAEGKPLGLKRLRQEATELLAEHTNSDRLRIVAGEMLAEITLDEEQAAKKSKEDPVAEDLALPVGLKNIGNTCYLNSLLQYLYTVKAVRDIATNYDKYSLNLEDTSIADRRLGGNKMQLDRGEAVVAQAFVKELGKLFHNLHTSNKVRTEPSQRLANAALLSTHALLEGDTANQPESTVVTAPSQEPPPLPDRPTQASMLPTPSPEPDMEMTQVTDTTSQEHVPSSNASSTTLIGMGDDQQKTQDGIPIVPCMEPANDSQVHDIFMDDVPAKAEEGELVDNKVHVPAKVEEAAKSEEAESVDNKVLRALEHQKRSSGTDQQDVEEVMGKIISLLQAAIKPTDVDAKTGIQSEKIMETFFVTTVNYTKKAGETAYQSEVSYDRSITAFPDPDRECSLYEALGRNFDQQVLEESKLSRYTAIRSLPPVLHVLIQRTLSTGQKNDNAVAIPETLYLDHYMDAAHESTEFEQRQADWAVASRLTELKKYQTDSRAFKGSGKLVSKMSRAMAMAVALAKAEATEGDQEMTTDSQTEPTQDAADKDVSPEEEQPDQLDDDDWSFEALTEDDLCLLSEMAQAEDTGLTDEETPASPVQPLDAPEEVVEAEETALRMIDEEIADLTEQREQHFSSSQKLAYRIEAIICHSGTLRAGHYWVWIRDFAQGLWRCYNDDNVLKVETDTDKLLQETINGGDPYYLCYVRDEDKEAWVDVPAREPETPSDSESLPELSSDQMVYSTDSPTDGESGNTESSRGGARKHAH